MIKSPWWMTGKIETEIGPIPVVSSTIDSKDKWGHFKVRSRINRMKYTVDSGLYGLGRPDRSSPVFVSANFKLSFDILRKELAGMDAWILVLDTKGINVWCAAGKGTFGTGELVNKIVDSGLSRIVSHKKLIIPQLGAPGVAAHEVARKTGFKVVFGPVRASDIPAFMEAGMKATSEMRRVRFTLADRLLLTPIEIVGLLKPVLILGAGLFAVDLLGLEVFSIKGFFPFVGAALVGVVLVPLLLPWIPGRAFAFKGWILGIFYTVVVCVLYGHLLSAHPDWIQTLVYFLILPTLSSFLAMNFTGSSTYTSLSGVIKEMSYAMPFFFVTGFTGLTILILKAFLHF